MEKTILESICNILGWQGGTIHQVYNEVKKLKQLENDIEKFRDIILNENSICIPEVGYKLKDCISVSCLSCDKIAICNFLAEKGLL